MKRKTSKAVAMALAAIIAVGTVALPTGAAAQGAGKSKGGEAAAESSVDLTVMSGEGGQLAFVTERSSLTQSLRSTESVNDLGRLVREYKYIRSVSDKSIYSYERPSVSLNGRTASVRGLVIGGTVFLPFRAVANLLGASYSYNSSAGTSVMRMSGLEVSATSGNYVVYANGRPLFCDTPTVIMNDGRMYIAGASLAKALGLRLSLSGGTATLSGSVSPLAHANSYYREDEVFWLARIIHAESSGEPLLGKIAVGNVVLNRVRSSEYPNTIYGVIFDRKYGVQFSPILNGSIYNTPSYNSRLAAMICLEGTDVSDGALFFLRPELSTSSWIPRTRAYAFTVGKHDFYY